MKRPNPLLLGLSLVLLGAAESHAQQPPTAEHPGIPVTSSLVVESCRRCHTVDDQGRMSRISWMRKTPEGWQLSVRRMAQLNGVDLDPATAREVVRYLADQHGIAPEELRPARWEVERRLDDYAYTPDEASGKVCGACHSVGRVMTQRRTPEEWKLVVAMHRGYYPLVDRQVFYDRSPDHEGPQPVDRAVAHFSKAFPLETPEWSAWSATMRTPRLEGRWTLQGHDPARGDFFGHVEVRPVSGADGEFTTEATYDYPEDGGRVRREGRAVVYTGFQWRGRSTAGSGEGDQLREVMMVERDWGEMGGRWFTGANDELGVDVTLRRARGGAVVTGVHPAALLRGARGAEVHVYGDGLGTPSNAEVDFGPGVRVTRVAPGGEGSLVVTVEVADDAREGARDLALAGALHPAALVVHGGVDRIEIRPRAGLARVGGAVFPKQIEQFEALGWADGPDGKSDTPDDLPLGRVPVTWSLEEFPVTYDDDDIDFVGSLDGNGRFTPALDGPNPERSGSRNNVGDLWVVAAHAREGGARPLTARAHLLVSVPLYMRWDPWPTTPVRNATDLGPAPGGHP